MHVVDTRALREAAHSRLSEGIVIDLGAADDDPDLLDIHEEITTSDAATIPVVGGAPHPPSGPSWPKHSNSRPSTSTRPTRARDGSGPAGR